MRCPGIRDRLSEYLDGELSPQLCEEVEAHLKNCPSCSQELSAFHDIRSLSAAMVDPVTPAGMWEDLLRQTQVISSRGQNVGRQPSYQDGISRWSVTSSRLTWWRWAAAAAILMGFGYLGHQVWQQRSRDQMAQVLTEYFREFQRDPRSAQQILGTKYGGRAVDVHQAARTVGFQPIAARGVPAGYLIEATYVVDMPCCTCIQCVFVRSDGSKMVLFEHCATEVGLLGDQPADEMICDGTTCTMASVEGQNAATWHQNQRHVTVLGVKDKAELEKLVGWFSDGPRTMAH